MKQETVDRIEAQVDNWAYLKQLPPQLHGFTLVEDRKINGSYYDILHYENKQRRRRVTLYYHDETWEFKVRTAIGLTEFCNSEFIAERLEVEESLLQQRLAHHLAKLNRFAQQEIDSIIIDKKIHTWRYLEKYPQEIEGFKLFLTPQEPVKVLNGSYIVFDYSDFAAESNFMIYYNIFRDEFFGEAKLHRIPEMTYIFDSHELYELEKLLDEHLVAYLSSVRAKINNV